MKKYSTVIFDLDGTLLNTIEDLTNALNHTLQEFDMPTRTLPEVQSFVGNGLRLLLIRAIPQGEDNPQFEEVFAAFKTYYTDHCKEATAPYPGIMELLKTLQEHHIPMAIVSNKNDAAVKRLAEDQLRWFKWQHDPVFHYPVNHCYFVKSRGMRSGC